MPVLVEDLTIELQRMMKSDLVDELYEWSQVNVNASIAVGVLSMLVLFFMQKSLKFFWLIINTLQLITYLPLIKANLAALALILLLNLK